MFLTVSPALSMFGFRLAKDRVRAQAKAALKRVHSPIKSSPDAANQTTMAIVSAMDSWSHERVIQRMQAGSSATGVAGIHHRQNPKAASSVVMIQENNRSRLRRAS